MKPYAGLVALTVLGTLLTATHAWAKAPPTEPEADAGRAPAQDSAALLPTAAFALAWNTFLGGSLYEEGRGIAVDAGGNVFVTGLSSGGWGVPIRPFVGNQDAFVARLDADGTPLWLTFLGSGVAGGDIGYAIAVDAEGNSYVTGTSNGSWGSPLRAYAGSGDAFVAKLDAGGTLLWNTFLGGSKYDASRGISVDANGNVSVVGRSDASWGTPVRPWPNDIYDVFVARLDATGTLLWNTFLGGGVVSGYHAGNAIAAGTGGTVLVTGDSNMSWGAPIRPWNGLRNAFVAEIDGDGNLLWNTFLGANQDSGFGIAVDSSGGIVVAGSSDGRSWGVPIRPMEAYGDAFVAKLGAGGELVWNTFLGGDQGGDSGTGIAVDAGGNIFVTGTSNGSWGDPVRAFSAFSETFAAKLDADGALLWNAFLGGGSWDYGYGIAVGPDGNAYTTGSSQAAWGDPIAPWAGSVDAFVVRIGRANAAPVALDRALGALEQTATAITLSATDADGDPLTFFVVALPAHGILGGDAPDLTYHPTPGFIGSDSFTFKANDGNLDSNTASVNITVRADTTPPTGSILINGGAVYTNAKAVILNLSAIDPAGTGLASMRFANSGYATTAWEPYKTTKAWLLSSGSGTRIVYAQFKDKAGNISDSDVAKAGNQGYRDTIVFDPIPPTGSILINNGAIGTSKATVTLYLSAKDTGGSGLSSMRFRNSSKPTWSAWETFKTTRAWTLTGGAGTKTVLVQFKDRAGNISDSDPITAGKQGYRDSINCTPP